MERLDDVCSGTSMHERKHVRGRTAHVRDCAYIRSHDMPNVLFLVLIYGDIPFNVSVSLVIAMHIIMRMITVSKLRFCIDLHFLENLLSASTFDIRVDIYERQLAFSRRRLKSASTFMTFSRRRLASTRTYV